LQRHRGLIAPKHHAVQQVVDTIQRPAAAEDLQGLDRLPAQKGAQQAAQAQYVVQVPVGQQDARQVPETHARLQDLPLGSLSAVHQKAVFIVLDNLGGEAAPRRRRGRRRAKKEDFKQSGFPLSSHRGSTCRMLIAQGESKTLRSGIDRTGLSVIVP
jgi:hypothetical protein